MLFVLCFIFVRNVSRKRLAEKKPAPAYTNTLTIKAAPGMDSLAPYTDSKAVWAAHGLMVYSVSFNLSAMRCFFMASTAMHIS